MKLNELISVIDECNVIDFKLHNKVFSQYIDSERWEHIYNHSELYNVKSVDVTSDYVIHIEVE